MGDTYHEAHMLVQAEIDAEREAIAKERGDTVHATVQHEAHRTKDSRIDAVLNDPSASDWLKNALRAALVRDCVDAARDAATLSLLLDVRAEKALRP